jgi:lysophospholipase L1-like esterase
MIRRLAIGIFTCCAVTCAMAQQVEKKTTPVHTQHYNQLITMFEDEPPITHRNYVMLGNSLTEFGGNWNKLLTGKDVGRFVNRGIMGDDAMGIYDRLYQILPYHPKKLFLMAGINDISHQLTADSVVVLVTKVIDKILAESPKTKLYLQSLLPINESFHRWKTMEGKTEEVYEVNCKLRQIAAARNIVYIDLFSLFTYPNTHIMRKELSLDGLHLLPPGYEIWSKALQPYIK